MSDIEWSAHKDFLENIEDDEAVAIVRRCLIPTDRLQIRTEIGKGNYGKVFNGTYIDSAGGDQEVAVKVAHGELIRSRVEFLMEAVLMADFDHRNVMWLIAIVIDSDMVPHVVLPLMQHGDLRSFVQEPTNDFLMKELIEFGLQVADGMDYLSARLVHRDLAARNCMVDADRVVKVADFGLARFTVEKEYYRPIDRHRALPIKWMALESMTEDIFTTKSDVWSYGVLLWELLTRGAKPYEDVEITRMRRHLKDGHRLAKPSSSTPDFVYALMQQCWDENPEQRPSFAEIKTYLDGHLSAGDRERAQNCPADEVHDGMQMIDVPVENWQMNDYVYLRHSVPAYSKSLPPLTSET